MVSIHHLMFLTISCTFYELKWIEQCHSPLRNLIESYDHLNVVLYNHFEELINMINYIPLCIIFIPIQFSQFLQGLTTFGEPKVSSTLGGFNIDFPSLLSFFPQGQNQVAEAFLKCMSCHNMHQDALIPLKLFHTEFEVIWVHLGQRGFHQSKARNWPKLCKLE